MTIAILAPVIGLIILGALTFFFLHTKRHMDAGHVPDKSVLVASTTNISELRPGPIYRVYEVRAGGNMKIQEFDFHNGCLVYAPKEGGEFTPVGLFNPEQNSVHCFGRECKLNEVGTFQSNGAFLRELWTSDRLLAERCRHDSQRRAS